MRADARPFRASGVRHRDPCQEDGGAGPGAARDAYADPGPDPRTGRSPYDDGHPGPSAWRDAALRTSVLIRHNTAVLLHEPGPLIGRLVMPLILLLALQPLYEAAQGAGGTADAVSARW